VLVAGALMMAMNGFGARRSDALLTGTKPRHERWASALPFARQALVERLAVSAFLRQVRA
jgi:hypothetical protein